MLKFWWLRIKDLKRNGGFQKYLVNTGWMFAGKFLSLCISFITVSIVARKLGPTDYGQLGYAVSFTSIFSFIATLGIDQVLTRELVMFPKKKDVVLGSAIIIRLFSGVIAVFLCLIFVIFLSHEFVSRLIIFIISLTFVFNAFYLLNCEFQARVSLKYSSIISLVINLVLNILKIVIIWLGLGIIYLALVLLLESVLYALAYSILFYKNNNSLSVFKLTFDKNIAKKILRDSWPMIFTGAFTLIYSRIDQIFIKQMIDTRSVGIYDAAVRLSEVWYLVPGIIMASFYPAIVSAKSVSLYKYGKRLFYLAIFLFFLSILIAILVSIWAKNIIYLIYGSAFHDSILILKIYIWSGIGVAFNTVISGYLVTENFRKALFFASFLSMFSNVFLNILLIPSLGIVGSAWATAISYLIGPLSVVMFKEPRKNLFYGIRKFSQYDICFN